MTQQDLLTYPSLDVPQGKPAEEHVEYLVVSDKNSEVILSSEDLGECRKLANKIRKCGGEVTLFKSIKF